MNQTSNTDTIAAPANTGRVHSERMLAAVNATWEYLVAVSFSGIDQCNKIRMNIRTT
jgi:hypothetical protein